MRDTQRIASILNRLGAVWYKYPDLRLAQLILNVVDTSPSAYYIEDEDLISKIEEFYNFDKSENL